MRIVRWLLLPALLSVVALVTATAVLPSPAVSAGTGYAGYAMAYFTESPTMAGASYGLHLAVSADGLNWTPLNHNDPVVTPTEGTGGLRDPYILRKQDGTFVILATDLNGTDFTQDNQYIHVWESTNLRTFTDYHRLRVHSLQTHSWAPEAFWDPARGEYAIIYSAYDNSSRHNVITVSYTADFATVTGDAQVFFDPGFSVIDGNLVSVGGVNYLYFKNNSNGTLLGARSSTLEPGSFTIYTDPIHPGRPIEAPQLVPSLTSRETYHLWGDSYIPNGRFFAWETTDLASGSWNPLSDRTYRQPLNAKHAGITPITAGEMRGLRSTWDTPSWSRLKSYQHPDRFVRRQGSVARLDAYPFDPYQDQLWKLVPGLASRRGVSFQSVADPTMYLRQSGGTLVLASGDGSAEFARQATFHRTAGLANPCWTSFRSHVDPDRYIRQNNDVLRVDPVTTESSTTDRADATFQIGY